MGDGGATRISLCGRLSVELEGARPELPGRQGRLLFAYLVLQRGRPVRRDELVEALVGAVDRVSEELGEGPVGIAARYEKRCAVIGQRVKIRLRPKGETRGTARHVDRGARLEIASRSEMVERVGIDQLLELTVV